MMILKTGLFTRAGEPTPFSGIKWPVFQLYTGPKALQNVEEIQTRIRKRRLARPAGDQIARFGPQWHAVLVWRDVRFGSLKAVSL